MHRDADYTQSTAAIPTASVIFIFQLSAPVQEN